MENSKNNEEIYNEHNWFTPIQPHTTTNKTGINIIENFEAGNFLQDIICMKSAPETYATLTPSAKRINSSAVNVKFGKLTLQRGPNKDLNDVRGKISSENKKRKTSRNCSPVNHTQNSKGMCFDKFKFFLILRNLIIIILNYFMRVAFIENFGIFK